MTPASFQPLIGLTIFDAKKGHGSFVTFSLTSTPESPVERFYFWIYLCYWWIRKNGVELAHNESTDAEIMSAVATLNSQKLTEIILRSNITQEGIFHGVSLFFSDGLTMKLCQYEDSEPEDPIFMTRNDSRFWVSYHTDGSIQSEQNA